MLKKKNKKKNHSIMFSSRGPGLPLYYCLGRESFDFYMLYLYFGNTY